MRRRCSHGLIAERVFVTSSECPACHRVFASRDGARTHFQKRLCPEPRGPSVIEPILHPPADTSATEQPPGTENRGTVSGSAQAMWGLTVATLTQPGTSASLTTASRTPIWRLPRRIGSMTSRRESTRGLNPESLGCESNASRRPWLSVLEGALGAQRLKKKMLRWNPPSAPGLNQLRPRRDSQQHRLPPLGSLLDIHLPLPQLLHHLLRLLLQLLSTLLLTLEVEPKERAKGREQLWDQISGLGPWGSWFPDMIHSFGRKPLGGTGSCKSLTQSPSRNCRPSESTGWPTSRSRGPTHGEVRNSLCGSAFSVFTTPRTRVIATRGSEDCVRSSSKPRNQSTHSDRFSNARSNGVTPKRALWSWILSFKTRTQADLESSSTFSLHREQWGLLGSWKEDTAPESKDARLRRDGIRGLTLD